MNLILHHFKKDVKHLKWLLGLWLIIVALQAILVGLGASNSSANYKLQATLEVIKFITPILQFILVLIITPRLIQEEPLVGTNAFWLTRPISGCDLLRSKTLSLFALLILPPLFSEGLILIFNDVNLTNFFLAIAEAALKQIAFVFSIAFLAVLTPSFAKYFQWLGIILVSMILFASIDALIKLYLGGEDFLEDYFQTQTLKQSQEIARLIFTCLAATVVIVHQYLTRDIKRSLWIGVPCVILSFVIESYWDWDFMKSPEKVVDKTKVNLEQVEVKIDKESSYTSDVYRRSSQKKRQKTVYTTIETYGLPPTMIARLDRFEGEIEFADGKKISARKRVKDILSRDDWNRDALEQAMPSYSVVNADDDACPGRVDWLKLDEEVFQAYGQKPAKISGTLIFMVYQYCVVKESPLQKGVIYQQDEKQDVITDVLKVPNGCRVPIRRRQLNLLFQNVYYKNTVQKQLSRMQENGMTYLLLNPKEKVAYCPEDSHDLDFNVFEQQNRLRIDSKEFYYTSSPENRKFLPPISEEWLKGAKLARVEAVPIGVFSKTVALNDFILEPSKRRNSHEQTPAAKKRLAKARTTLKTLTLSLNPSREEAETYIEKVLVVSALVDSTKRTDPEVEKLVALGPDYITLLLDYADYSHARYAIETLARPSHKPIILEAFKKNARLISVIKAQGWEKDARDTLLSILQSRERWADSRVVELIAKLQDPSTYPTLKDFFIRGRGRDETYEAIRVLPNFALADSVQQAWEKAKTGDDDEIEEMLPVAVEWGYLDALEKVIKYSMLEKDSKDLEARTIRKILQQHLTVSLPLEKLPEWFEQNRERIEFDKTSKKFILKP